MKYTPHSPEDIKEMLRGIGVKNIAELFGDIPEDFRPSSFKLPEGLSEFEALDYFKGLAKKNSSGLLHFVGGGFYDHYIPSVVEALSSRAEFSTAYTPYQPESSQGTLQALYEYQTVICELTGMDAANASLYDGATALYEAMLMAIRINGRNKVLIDSGVNAIYRKIIYTYTSNLDIEFVEIPVAHGQSDRSEIANFLDDKTSAIILQNPNFFGAVDDHSDIIDKAHNLGALAIESVYPISLGLLKTPGEMGADIVTGEGQSLGNPLSFGGPYLGFIATKTEYIRKMPGRICGKTVDINGKEGFVLTLQAREQHIRRQKATSNICSNQNLCALRALIYLCVLGKKGLKTLARELYDRSEYAKGALEAIAGLEVKRSSPTFNEFTVHLPVDASVIVKELFASGIACGIPLGNYYAGMEKYLLIAVTEKHSKQDIRRLAENMEKTLCSLSSKKA